MLCAVEVPCSLPNCQLYNDLSSSFQEHGIPTDGSEQPDMTQLELSSRVNDTLHIDSIDLDQSGNFVQNICDV